METAQQKKDGGEVKTKKPQVIKYGLNHVKTFRPSSWSFLTMWIPLSWCFGCQRCAGRRMSR